MRLKDNTDYRLDGGDLPGWVKAIKDKKELTSVIQTHIKTVMGRYKGRIRAWVRLNLLPVLQDTPC